MEAVAVWMKPGGVRVSWMVCGSCATGRRSSCHHASQSNHNTGIVGNGRWILIASFYNISLIFVWHPGWQFFIYFVVAESHLIHRLSQHTRARFNLRAVSLVATLLWSLSNMSHLIPGHVTWTMTPMCLTHCHEVAFLIFQVLLSLYEVRWPVKLHMVWLGVGLNVSAGWQRVQNQMWRFKNGWDYRQHSCPAFLMWLWQPSYASAF